jgi:hypothetical protein
MSIVELEHGNSFVAPGTSGWALIPAAETASLADGFSISFARPEVQ